MARYAYIEHDANVGFGTCRSAATDIFAAEIENDPRGILSLEHIHSTNKSMVWVCEWQFTPIEEFVQ